MTKDEFGDRMRELLRSTKFVLAATPVTFRHDAETEAAIASAEAWLAADDGNSVTVLSDGSMKLTTEE